MTVHFNEEWFGAPSQFWLAQLARSVSNLEGLVVEVGCWEGRSTVALANAVAPTIVHAIDTWEGAPSEPSQLEIVQVRDVYRQFLANMDAGTKQNYWPYRMDWRCFAWDQPIKFLHIDGEHTYEQVFDNIVAAKPNIVPGGIICGDDASHPPVIKAVRELLDPIRLEASLWIWKAPK